MIFTIDGMPITIIDTGDRMVDHMQKGDGYEHDSLTAWAKIVEPHKIALDIGAYTGLFSIVAAMRGANVIAMEPMPANRWRLGVNVAANKVAVRVLEYAASDREDIVQLHYNPNVPLTTGASLEEGVAMHSATIDVRCMTVDALALKDVAAIKIDVERHEPAVLRGAARTIARCLPALLVETLDDAMRDEVLAMLPAYKVAAILDRRNTLFTPLL